ncbi:MAG: molybdopterin-dependent oxidoreductase [Deltaproteobacteria bacterium]|nr:molybdopterin-dependent oxidoreductase [Deltaproteobacteria bacterium]
MPDELRWEKTHCARMDHGGCALVVGVKNNRVVKIKGDPDGYLNRGYICPKALALPDRLNHPDRLLTPLKRTGSRGDGKWAAISWETALAEISHRMLEAKGTYGARSVAFCQGMPKGMEHFALIRLANLFGSPNVVATQDVCHAPREITGLHTCGFYPVTDFHHRSRLVILWGSNLTATNEEGEICRPLLDQMKAGTRIIVVDPRKTALADKAEQWLQIQPGTDHALALAFLEVIIRENLYDRNFVSNWTHGFDELAAHVRSYTPEKVSNTVGVPPEMIRRAALSYAKSRPAAIQWGNPIEQNIHAFQTTRALVCLMAICGNLDTPGGNLHKQDPPIMNLGQFVRADLLPDKRKEMIHASHGTIPRLMTVPPAYFKKAVLTEKPYPVKAAYFQCTNPLVTWADSHSTLEVLRKLDFIAVADICMTPTAAFADIVLPAATHLEFDDIGHYGLGHGCILARPKIVDPPAECWPDIKIINELGKIISPAEHWYTDDYALLSSVVSPADLTYTQFVQTGFLKGPERFKKYEKSGFKTPTGKVELVLSRAERFKLPPLPLFDGLPEKPDPDYPLVLISSKDPLYLHSSYRWIQRLRKRSPGPVAEIHPDTASAYGIRSGDEVSIETCKGSIRQVARVTTRIRPGIVNAAYGWWFPEGKKELQYEWKRSGFNVLTSTDRLGREFGTPNLKGINCQIKLLE